MTFLFALIVATFIPIAFLFKRIRSAVALEQRQDAVDVAGVLCLLLIDAGFMSAILARSWSDGDTNWSPILMAVGGVGMCFVGVHHLWRTYRGVDEKALSANWSTAWLLVSACGLYLGWTGFDHYLFWQDRLNAGIAADVIYKQSDIQCDYPYVLLKREGGEITYRCPHNLFMGHPIGEPFVPWPTYSTGVSKNMQAVQDRLMEEAKRPSEDTAANAQ